MNVNKRKGWKKLLALFCMVIINFLVLTNISHAFEGKFLDGTETAKKGLEDLRQKFGKVIEKIEPNVQVEWQIVESTTGPGAWGGVLPDPDKKGNLLKDEKTGKIRGVIYVDHRWLDGEKKLPQNQLDFLIAHESAHVALKHSEVDLTVPIVDIEKKPTEWKLERQLSREQEKLADNFALNFMTMTGYKIDTAADAAISFFRGRIAEIEQQKDVKIGLKDIKELFKWENIKEIVKGSVAGSTHPDHSERIGYIEQRKQIGQAHLDNVPGEISKLNAKPSQPTAPPKTALAPTDKLRGGDPQQNVTPVKVTFSETFSGTMSQTIGEWGHRSTPFEGNFTGSRTGVLPGNFTGNFTGTNTYDPPLQANPNYRNISFTGSMNGETKPGFREGELKVQNVGVTITDNRVPNVGNIFTYSGDGTLKADGSLNVNLRPPDNQPKNNYQYGSCPACGYIGTSTIQLNQTPR